MTQPISISFLPQLRRDAKRLRELEQLSHAQALDRIARERGYTNWSLLVRNATYQPSSKTPAPALPDMPVTAPSSAPSSTPATVSAVTATAAPLQSRILTEPGAFEKGLQAMMDMPRLNATRAEREVILGIVRRFEDLVGDDLEVNRLSTMMDLEACHCNGCPLDLEGLRDSSRDVDLVHDVAGIGRYLDRDTGKLTQVFTPRYAARSFALEGAGSAE